MLGEISNNIICQKCLPQNWVNLTMSVFFIFNLHLILVVWFEKLTFLFLWSCVIKDEIYYKSHLYDIRKNENNNDILFQINLSLSSTYSCDDIKQNQSEVGEYVKILKILYMCYGFEAWFM